MWQEKNKRSDFLDKQNSADSVPIPSLGRLESMVSQGLPTISCLKNFIGNIQIESETGRRTLKDLCARLWLKFPVEFVMRSEESGHLLAEYPMSMKLEKDANGNINLLMRHRAGYNKKCKLPEAILFLLRAKMTETSFPGFMVEGDKHTREIYGEIAYQLKDPYFPGRETPYLGQVYPYPVYNVNKETITHAGIIHRAITIFYELELLAKMYPTPFLGGELYEALLWEILLPTKPKTIEAMLREVTIGVAESKLNYGKKHAFLPQFSDELERLVQIHGATLFLKALQERWGEKIVFALYLTLSKLPLEEGKGFNTILLNIDKAFRELYVLLEEGYTKDTIDRLRSMVELREEFGGLRGQIMVKEGPLIAFT